MSSSRPIRRVLAAGTAAAALSTGCSALAAEQDSILDQDQITIGVKGDQPGLGLEVGEGEFEGFDVDVAEFIASELGFEPEDVEFVEVPSAVREYVLMEGEAEPEELRALDVDTSLLPDAEVDMVVATYSITPQRRQMVNFAGPYYLAQQDILVGADDTETDNVRDLEGATLCQGTGSNSANRIVEERGVGADIDESDTYGECLERLADGEVDAVSTDNLILAGFALEDPDAFRMVNAPFTSERYGVGLRKSDVAGCEEVNRAITTMYRVEQGEDTSPAERMLEGWFAETGLDLNTSVPQFEGCG
jgi:glutamate transport system substrate-binding protein